MFAHWPSILAGVGLLIGPSIEDVFGKLIVLFIALGAANAAAGVAYAFALDVTPVTHRGLAGGFTNMFAWVWVLGLVPLTGATIAVLLLLITRRAQSPAAVAAEAA